MCAEGWHQRRMKDAIRRAIKCVLWGAISGALRGAIRGIHLRRLRQLKHTRREEKLAILAEEPYLDRDVKRELLGLAGRRGGRLRECECERLRGRVVLGDRTDCRRARLRSTR